MKKIILATVLFLSTIVSAGSVTGLVTFVKIDAQEPSHSYVRFNSYDGGAAWGFDYTTDKGKAIYSMILTAKSLGKQITIWSSSTYWYGLLNTIDAIKVH